MTKQPEMLLWLSDARGVFIPRDFAQSFADRAKHVSGVTAEQWAILDLGPNQGDSEDYWMTWTEVCDNAIVTDDNGVKFRIWQDGDCWLVPDGMEWSDENETFQWPAEETAEADDE